MNTSKHLRRLYVLALVVFGAIANAGATSANTDLSDIWWNPNESGWGLQMVNTGTLSFATIYVYGPNGSPTWYTGQLNKAGDAQTTYTGPLYATTGPYFGGAFNQNAVTARQVGTMTFLLQTVNVGRLTYSVDGVVVSKFVQRQPLTLDDYNGEYLALVTRTFSGCLRPVENGRGTDFRNVAITQNGQSLVLVAEGEGGFSCTYSGTYSQLGRMGQIQGTYACTSGDVGTVTIFEMNNAPYMFTARLQSQSSNLGCTASGEIMGLIPR